MYWKVTDENCGGGLNIVDENNARIAHTAEYRDKSGTIITSQEAQANARLLAAAPELLAALELIEKAATFVNVVIQHQRPDGQMADDLPKAIDAARAAIAKAKE